QYPVGAPWNNFNSAAFAGKTISNLMNDEQQVTPVSVTLVTAWEGDNDLGAVTGNNTGVFPDNVMKTAYYESSSTPKVVRISGLSTQPGMKYNLVFFASRAAGDIRNTVYSSGGNSVTLNVSNNTNTTVQLNGLVPNANGVIEFTVTKGAGAPYAYIGAMVIQSYFDNGQPIAPSNLIVAAKSKSSIQLNWADKSGNEDGFQIFRALNPNGPFNLIHTTGANATSYLNTGLQENTMYYYKVRAVKGNAYSDFTNIMGISTYTMSVYINFNRTNNASNPWYNNTARAPEEGYVFSNLRNDKNQQTGINMTVVRNFSGDNPSGMNTGNNSGVVPDNVMRSSWWLDYGMTAELKLTGFNQNWAYTFVFFGSRNGGGDRTSIYTIGNRSVALNASYNTAQTVQIENVRPDENGEISIIVSLAQYAEFAYLNGMIIHGYEVADDIEANLGDTQSDALVPGGGEFKALIETTSDVVTPKTDEAVILTQAMEHQLVVTKLQVFPNPVIDEIKVSAVFEKAQSNVSLRVMDLAGRTVYTQNFGKAQGGSWTQRLNLGKHLNKPGVYLLQITGDEKSKPATFKLLKSN
ncbi:MAG TPA: fibronectin type III domain-containing protein, partial [Parasegetibacter sp.]